jgi:hypothetical protein
MAALMIKEQKSREGGVIVSDIMHGMANYHRKETASLFHRCAGDLKLVDGASKGGIEELKASADSIAKIAKKISALHLGDKQVACCVCRAIITTSWVVAGRGCRGTGVAAAGFHRPSYLSQRRQTVRAHCQ